MRTTSIKCTDYALSHCTCHYFQWTHTELPPQFRTHFFPAAVRRVIERKGEEGFPRAVSSFSFSADINHYVSYKITHKHGHERVRGNSGHAHLMVLAAKQEILMYFSI